MGDWVLGRWFTGGMVVVGTALAVAAVLQVWDGRMSPWLAAALLPLQLGVVGFNAWLWDRKERR